MRVSVWFVISILLVGGTGSLAAEKRCTSTQPRNDSALLQLEQSWAKALEQHDSATVECILADGFEDVDVNGNLHNRADTLARVPLRHPSQNQLQEMQSHVYGDFAFVRGLNNVTGPDGKVLAQVRFTDIFVHRDGRWQAVAGHETLVTSEPR